MMTFIFESFDDDFYIKKVTLQGRRQAPKEAVSVGQGSRRFLGLRVDGREARSDPIGWSLLHDWSIEQLAG
jgi:hypothetical protein